MKIPRRRWLNVRVDCLITRKDERKKAIKKPNRFLNKIEGEIGILYYKAEIRVAELSVTGTCAKTRSAGGPVCPASRQPSY